MLQVLSNYTSAVSLQNTLYAYFRAQVRGGKIEFPHVQFAPFMKFQDEKKKRCSWFVSEYDASSRGQNLSKCVKVQLHLL